MREIHARGGFLTLPLRLRHYLVHPCHPPLRRALPGRLLHHHPRFRTLLILVMTRRFWSLDC